MGINLRGRCVTVVGLARSGLAACRLLDAVGARVTATDLRSEEELRDVVDELPPSVRFFLGGHPPEALEGADWVVVSPGVPADHPFLAAALGADIPVVSELEMAYRIGRPPMVAVTGTNGKSTTATLCCAMLREAGLRALACGNLGLPLSAVLLDGSPWDWLVCEVSSFQLEWVRRFQPQVAVLLNVTPDHLDRHGSFDSYAALKGRLLSNLSPQDTVVYSRDDPVTASLAGERAGCERVSFGRLSKPPAAGAYLDGEEIRLCLGEEDRVLVPLAAVPLRGVHNIENVMAASLAALVCGADLSSVGRAVSAFSGLEHRMEWVADVEGVPYYNDSKGTNTGATLRSLESFSQPVVWIAGGRSKDADLTALRAVVVQRVRQAVFFGETAEALAAICHPLGLEGVHRVADLGRAVCLAHDLARKGDAVLLSPACASFDQFRDFEERGRAFKQDVRSLLALCHAEGGSP